MANIIKNAQVAELFIQATACNTTGNLKDSNATDLAILKFLSKIGNDFEKKREEHLPEGFMRFQFTSKRKKMGTILENINDNQYGYNKRLIVKGAVEIVLGTCNTYLDQDGQHRNLTKEKREELDKIITSFAKDSLRCICLAYKDLKENEGGQDHDEMHIDKVNRVVEQDGLTCIGIVGIRDVIRDEVPEAIRKCNVA